MDVIKIGQFIRSLRKEANLTQREVAEKLNVSEKTISKWETGKGFPEISLMLPLCELFNISMNELLTGERLTEKQYVEKAEENIAYLIKDRTAPRTKVVITAISGIFATLSSLMLILLSAYFITEIWLRLVLIGIALIVLISDIAVILLVAVSTEIYECKNCGKNFVPTFSAYLLGPHTLSRRYLKCPHCGKKCWDKSHIRQ